MFWLDPNPNKIIFGSESESKKNEFGSTTLDCKQRNAPIKTCNITQINFCIELRYNKNLQRPLNLLVTLQQSAC
jgi:hypothetical protein